MQQQYRDQVDWEQAFPPEEYQERITKVRSELARQGLDGIYINSGANLTYLTAYDMIWYNQRALTGIFVRADSNDTIFFDEMGHRTLVSTTPEIRDIVWFDQGPEVSNIEHIVGSLKSRELLKGTIGLEKVGYSPHATVMDELQAAVEAGGARVVDSSTLVEDIRLVKSPREIETVRRAAEIGDKAMAAARDSLRPGISETAIESVIMGTMMTEGGTYPSIRTMLGSGPRSGTHHSPPTLRQVRQGDLVFIDFCGCYHRYHVNVNRTFSVGEPDPRYSDMMDKSAVCVDKIVEAIKPGDPLTKVQEVADEYIDSVGLRKYVWFVGGYSTGISVPPDWVGRTFFRPFQPNQPDRNFEPGMLLNFENQFDVFDEVWRGGSGAAYIESFLMTDNGIEVLSKLPRNLVVV